METSADILQRHLADKQRRNPTYSLRAYSRDLGVHPGTLSAFLNRKRSLPQKTARKICDRLNLSPKYRNQFLTLNQIKTESIDVPATESLQLNETQFQIIAEWEHYAFLSLMELRNFPKAKHKAISTAAKRLEISIPRVKVVLERLLKADLIKLTKTGMLERTFERLSTTEDIVSQALRKAHSEELDLAKRSVEKTEIEKCEFRSTTLAIHPRNIAAAKKAMRKFQEEIELLLESEDATEVYQMCLQFFPLTKTNFKESNNDKH